MMPIPSDHAPGPPDDPGLWSRRAHEVVESVADRMPGHTALVCADVRLTYAQLDQRANAIAHDLIERGLRPGDRVALVMPRCHQLFVALLGVLKAGGVYVPLDPAHPEDRNRRIIDAAEPAVVLVAPTTGPQAWLVDQTVADVGDASSERPDRPGVDGSADDLAYILFTSGSTGEPKGVPIRHDGISRLVLGQDYAPFGPELSWLKLAPMGFDASTVEIYGAWMWGAPLVVWDRDTIDADAIADLIEREGVRACFLSFGLFSTLLDASPRFFEHIRLITTGSEPVLPSVIKRASDRYPDMRIVVAYGPTEATAFTTTFPGNDPDQSLPTVPLGKPLRGLHCRLLDEHGRPVPPGKPGEICIGGVGITPGYLNRPDLNARAFVDDPCQPGERLYRSGDLARELPSGDLLFLGRVDNQVKVRGNRVELGEIESVVERMPGVHRAAAAVAGARDNQHVVVGVIATDAGVDPDAVRTHAASGLPPYMVPSIVGVLDVFPATENGKIDRTRLAELVTSVQDSEPAAHNGSEAPETDTERVVADIWRDVLDLRAVRRSDTFLKLGGHSLRAIVACARIRAATGVRVTVPEMMRLGTLAAVAARIDAGRGSPDDGTEPLRLAQDELSDAQQRLWLLDRLMPGDPTYTITLRIRFDAPIDRSAFERACRGLVERHEALRTGFEAIGEDVRRHVLPVSDDAPMPLDIRWADEAGGDRFDREFASATFDLRSPPLVRFAVRPDGSGAVVLVAMHHIVSDGWSCGVIRHDLLALYEAATTGVPADLPTLPPDPSGLWNEAWTPDDAAWWDAYLRDAERVRLHRERAAPPRDPRSGVTESIELSGETVAGIRALASGLGVTSFAVVFAAYNVWLHRVTRCEDLVVGTPVACRDVPGLEHAVGFFMATLPARVHVGAADTAADVITRTAESYRAAEGHRAVPFRRMIEGHHAANSPDDNPLFGVFFNHIAMDFGSGDGGVTPDDVEIDNGTAKFDLTCYALETQDAIRLKLNARAGLVDAAALRRWCGQLARTLDAVVRDPDAPIASIRLLDAVETERFETNRVRPARPFQGPRHAFARVRAIAEQDPARIAVIDTGVSLTYGELIRDALRVRTALRDAGLRPGERVLCRCEGHTGMARAVLGVLAADACYVPVDPSWPQERLAAVAEQAQAASIITDFGTHEFLDLPTLRIDAISHLNADVSEPAQTRADGEGDAYVLFTSGSTGTPKGVVQTHAGLCAQMEAFADSVGITPDDRVGMTSSHAFDSAVMDMFGAWFRGAAWCPIALDRGEPSVAQIDRSGITLVHAAPSVLRDMGSQNGISQHVRAVVLGGEPARSADLAIVGRLFPACRLVVNGMGMSESSLTVQWRTEDPSSFAGGDLPIGTATSGIEVRLLAPDGTETDLYGEVEIQSKRIARGVIGSDPGRVRPLGTEQPDGTRRFATGDLARVRPDGQLEHMGRSDAQIKVSGVRIEPGEVRAALCAIDEVSDAAVVGDSTASGAAVLCAAVVCRTGQTIDPVTLRDRLTDRLPRAMLPGRIAVVDALPRTGGGKVSIPAVRALCRNAGRGTERTREAESDTERIIAEVFAAVLGHESVGVEDDFFALGGSSLLALRAFARLRDRLGTNLPVISMFRAPTPARLAALIRDEGDAVGDASLVRLGTGAQGPICLLPGIGGNPHSFAPIVERLGTTHDCLGYQLPGVMGESEPLESVELIADHLLERLPEAANGRAPALVGYSFGGTLAFEAGLRMQRRGWAPGALVLVDAHFMPGLPRKSVIGRAWAHMQSMVSATGSGRLTYFADRLARKRKPRTLGGVYQTDETLASVKRLILANRQALEAYQPAQRYRGDALLFRARQPAWMRFHRDDGANGWRAVIEGQIRIVEIDVAHNRVLHESSADLIARHIADFV